MEVRALPAIETLRQVWERNFKLKDGQVEWRTHEQIPPAGEYINAPYDPEARYASKGTTCWTGYKLIITETCEADTLNLITTIETTTAPVANDAVTEKIHATLRERHLVPETNIADTGFMNSKVVVDSKETYGIEVIGPTRSDKQWQAQAGQGFAASEFEIDWDKQQARCPAGKTRVRWTPALDRANNEVITIKFATIDCYGCRSRAKCTRSTPPRRTITLRPEKQHEALQAGRQREQTDTFKTEYAKRAGVEGTIA